MDKSSHLLRKFQETLQKANSLFTRLEQQVSLPSDDVTPTIHSEITHRPEPSKTKQRVREDSLLNTQQVAERLNVSRRTVDTLIHSGEIASIKIRGCRRILPEALDAYIERLAREASSR
jgi:excisionase family DNA binding protein